MLAVYMSKLSPEEKEILEALESGRLKQVENVEKEIEKHRSVAEATLKKDARINIRLSSRDLRALKEGIPYQTLVSSVIHKFVEGQLVEKPGIE